MNALGRLSIRIKLLLLSGIPVIGALLLAGLITHDARKRAATADALGSIEDLARLTSQMSSTVHALQRERAYVALHEGYRQQPNAQDVAKELPLLYANTDTTLRDFEAFLAGRDLSKLPPRLGRDLATARLEMTKLGAFREHVALPASASVDEIIAFYGAIDDALISATAALAELSDDAELLRGISSLVALAELTERASVEQALLANVFAAGQFPPGAFKSFVTNVTAQAIYTEFFRANAKEDVRWRQEIASSSASAREMARYRERALTTTDDTLDIEPRAWFDTSTQYLAELQSIERSLTLRISDAASRKVAATRLSVRIGVGLSAAVVVLSAILAWVIAQGITQSISALADSASRVRETKDFGIRAPKLSRDELGMLTDAFNEMLSDIQSRDAELEGHRGHLEDMVAARTEQLAARNAAMRLVLDTVDQGLATVNRDGTLATERSAAFDRFLGVPGDGVAFADHLAQGDEATSLSLVLGWEMFVDELLPPEVVVDQLPRRITRGGSHFELDFKPFFDDGGHFDGALLVITDVTAVVKTRREQEQQRELIAVFQRVASDREGFIELAKDAGELLTELENATRRERAMVLLHTLKGNSGQWGMTSVARIAHDIETAVVDGNRLPTSEELASLATAWGAVNERLRPLVGGVVDRLEITRADLDPIVADLRAGVSPTTVAHAVESLAHEPTRVRFERMTEDVARLAERFEKPSPRVVIESNGVRLPPARFGSFWASAVHLIRNMLDHGIESPRARIAAGKSERGTVTLRSTMDSERFTVAFEDDGRGIDWEAVAKKARESGLRADTHADLERALFAPGLSTSTLVTEISGRGVGLAAVAERCAALGGVVQVSSRLGRSTRFTFVFPRSPRPSALLRAMALRAS